MLSQDSVYAWPHDARVHLFAPAFDTDDIVSPEAATAFADRWEAVLSARATRGIRRAVEVARRNQPCEPDARRLV